VIVRLFSVWICGWIQGWQVLLEKQVCFLLMVWMAQNFHRHCTVVQQGKRWSRCFIRGYLWSMFIIEAATKTQHLVLMQVIRLAYVLVNRKTTYSSWLLAPWWKNLRDLRDPIAGVWPLDPDSKEHETEACMSWHYRSLILRGPGGSMRLKLQKGRQPVRFVQFGELRIS